MDHFVVSGASLQFWPQHQTQSNKNVNKPRQWPSAFRTSCQGEVGTSKIKHQLCFFPRPLFCCLYLPMFAIQLCSFPSSFSTPYLVTYLDGNNHLQLYFENKDEYLKYVKRMDAIRHLADHIFQVVPENPELSPEHLQLVKSWLLLVSQAQDDNLVVLPSILEVRIGYLTIFNNPDLV